MEEGNRFQLARTIADLAGSKDLHPIGDVSHELRTPLTAIKGSMEGLMDGVLPATDETYQQIQAEADRLNRLVDDLQELNRVEARAYQLDIRSLDVSALVQTVNKRLAPHSKSKRISLDLELAPDFRISWLTKTAQCRC